MQSSDIESKTNRVVGGHKAAMHNPNVSAEAKEHSRQVIEEIQGSGVSKDYGSGVGKHVGSDVEKNYASGVSKPIGTTEPSSRSYDGDKEENRVLGGYKATLKNPNVSDEAKQRAEQILEDRNAL